MRSDDDDEDALERAGAKPRTRGIYAYTARRVVRIFCWTLFSRVLSRIIEELNWAYTQTQKYFCTNTMYKRAERNKNRQFADENIAISTLARRCRYLVTLPPLCCFFLLPCCDNSNVHKCAKLPRVRVAAAGRKIIGAAGSTVERALRLNSNTNRLGSEWRKHPINDLTAKFGCFNFVHLLAIRKECTIKVCVERSEQHRMLVVIYAI